jgi:hypothetical protein
VTIYECLFIIFAAIIHPHREDVACCGNKELAEHGTLHETDGFGNLGGRWENNNKMDLKVVVLGL